MTFCYAASFNPKNSKENNRESLMQHRKGDKVINRSLLIERNKKWGTILSAKFQSTFFTCNYPKRAQVTLLICLLLKCDKIWDLSCPLCTVHCHRFYVLKKTFLTVQKLGAIDIVICGNVLNESQRHESHR